ncbi:putative membrane protein [Bacteroides fragilis str. 3986 T(B)9]|uniref:Membrane protein n=8 Tax=Bacteroides fragilis TaxID=817 RepID=A0AAN4SHJ4_BACFG|nr:putative membrane protein [Bacteroides fragilis str. 1007-1-F \
MMKNPAFFLPVIIEIIDSFCFLCNAFYLYLYRAKRSKP